MPDGVTDVDGLLLPPPPLAQPVNHTPALKSSSNSDTLRSRAFNHFRLVTNSGISPGSANNAAHRTACASLFPKGAESRRAWLPVVSVKMVLAVLVVPENETEAGWKLQFVFCGSPVQENCSVPA